MPQREDKWKSMFADLGRPTMRGIRKCPKCGTVNGTRGNSCKNKSCDVIFRGNGPRKKPSTEACRISNLPGCEERIYSVRVRDRGPDYRNFVQLIDSDAPAHPNDMDIVGPSTAVLAKCFVDTCSVGSQQTSCPCPHIIAAQRCFSESQPLTVKQSVLSAIHIPSEYYEVLSHLINELPNIMVQRVSKTSFVAKCEPSSRHPLGFLHIMFIKPTREDSNYNIEKRFLCSCRPFKLQSRETEIAPPSNSPEHGNKFCLHYYACMCAFASNEALANEFEHFISQPTHEYSPPLLSQLQLVALPQSSNRKSVDTLDPNHISVEIMRENISLLESIAAGDDSSLTNVQGLEGVLSDQIIVTNVDDSLAFGDSAVLDSLDDTDQQVCQIFANAQNTIQLATFTTGSDNQPHSLEISTASEVDGEDRGRSESDHIFVKRKKENRNTNCESTHTHNATLTQLPIITTQLISSNIQNATVTYTTAAMSSMGELVTSCEKIPPAPVGFEEWLAGVNDRINATMNYQLTTTPDPLVYYISTEYFEYLKQRIATGGKRRRLPNHTIICHRTDRAPIGTYTKHIWKILNIVHITQIFECSIIQLKTKQYFVKTHSGNFVEWFPPKNNDERNQRIFPVLHSTFLKCGRNHESSSRESVPFVIEWIPEILRDSKLGELSLSFEFGRHDTVRNT